MIEQCDKCGVDYTPMVLEYFAKNSKIAEVITLCAYVVLGGYALASYYFLDSILSLFLCSIIALAIYHFSDSTDQSFCDTCVEENRS